MLEFMIATPKRHILARNRVFWHILRQNRLRGLGCSELQEPKKRKKTSIVNTFRAQSHTCAETKPLGDRDELLHRCRGPRRSLITSANFYDCRLWGLSVVGVKFWVFPLTPVVALTTLSHCRASV